MSLFGTSPPNDGSPSLGDSSVGRSRNSLFDDDDGGPTTRSTSDSLFNDDDHLDGSRSSGSPWDMPTPRRQQSRAELLRGLLAGADIPDSYAEAFDRAVAEDGDGNVDGDMDGKTGGSSRVTRSAVARTLAAARLGADNQARIMAALATPAGSGNDAAPIGRNEFNVLLALIGLAQEGETPSLDGVDERRRSKLNKPEAFYLAITL